MLASVVVPRGTFNCSTDPTWPPTVSAFRLDLYEVTAGRFRKYLAANPATMTTPAAPGAGAHEEIPGRGLDAWNDFQSGWLAYDKDALVTKLHCGDPAESTPYAPLRNNSCKARARTSVTRRPEDDLREAMHEPELT